MSDAFFQADYTDAERRLGERVADWLWMLAALGLAFCLTWSWS